jgi:1-deoxy-D-xylulose-5-phosphate reductoisomerase
MKKIIILGSTGSIGQQTLEVIRKFPREFEVVGLSGGENRKLLQKQVKEFKPKFISTKFPQKFPKQKFLPLTKLALQKCDLMVVALSGVVGLLPTFEAIKAKNNIALANKECLVMGGEIVMREAKKRKVKIFPIDSEHSALWMLFEKIPREKIKRVVLTASGGALRDTPIPKLSKVSPRQVLNHPTWKMGSKITLDCATLANKAFEIIEAHHLFNLPYEKIEAIIHPQSLIHAMVETIDGNIFMQASTPDMKLPISLALFEGERKERVIEKLDLATKNLEFQKIDAKRYPLFSTILEASAKGGIYPTLVASTSEFFGKQFLEGKIPFTSIVKQVKNELEKTRNQKATLKNILKIVKKYEA